MSTDMPELPKKRRGFICTKCGWHACKPGSEDEAHPPCNRCDYLGFGQDLDYSDDEMRAYVLADRALRPSGGRDLDVHQVSAPVEISSCATCGHPVESGGERPAAADEGEPTNEHLIEVGSAYMRGRRDALHEAWRPIATAPKDGTYILVSNPRSGGAWVAHWEPVAISGYRFDEPWRSCMLNHWHLAEPGRYAPPTHWQPLPSLAASGSQEAGSTECKESSPLSPANQGIDHE